MKLTKLVLTLILLLSILFSSQDLYSQPNTPEPSKFVIGLYGVHMWGDSSQIGLIANSDACFNVFQNYPTLHHTSYYWLGPNKSFDDASDHLTSQANSLEYLEKYIDSVKYYSDTNNSPLYFMPTTGYWYEEYNDRNDYSGTGVDWNGNNVIFLDYDWTYRFLKDSISTKNNYIWGYYLADEPNNAGDKHVWGDEAPRLHEDGVIPYQKVNNAYNHFDSLISNKNHVIAVGYNGTSYQKDYWDISDILIESRYSTNTPNYIIKMNEIKEMKDEGVDVQPAINIEYPTPGGGDNDRMLATIYRSLQMEVSGIWFYSYIESYNSANGYNKYTQLSDVFTNKAKPYSQEIASLANSGYLPFYVNRTNTAKNSSGTSTLSNIVVKEFFVDSIDQFDGTTVSVIIAVNESDTPYNNARIYNFTRDSTASFAEVKFENSSDQRGYNYSHEKTVYSDGGQSYLQDDFDPWDAHVYYVLHSMEKRAGEIIPKEFELSPNYPNPFNPETNIEYQLPKTSDVSIKIYNINGQEIATLVNESQNPGIYKIKWNGKNSTGTKVSSGIYLVSMITPEFTKTQKITLIR